MKKIAFIAAGFALALAASLPARADSFGLRVADAGVSIGVQIGTPPPPAPYEMIPAPRPGFVWAPGYWTWDGYRYVWVQGRWMAQRPGYIYAPGMWIQSGPSWTWQPERWHEERHWREEHREHERHEHHEDRGRDYREPDHRGGWHGGDR